MSQDSSTARAKSWSAIIQARTGATRLPGKVLMDLGGKPIIAHVVDRIRFCEPENIILAIPDKSSDDPLEHWARKNDVEFVRGSEDDVLSRILLASEKCPSDILIRSTADNPFIETEIILKTIQSLINDDADFAVMDGSPVGTTIEAFTRKALERLDKIAKTQDEREHLSVAIWNNPDSFKIILLEAPSYFRCDGLRLTIDTENDLRLARILFNALAGDIRMISLREIIKYVNHNPLVKRINACVEQHLDKWLKEKKSELSHIQTAVKIHHLQES